MSNTEHLVHKPVLMNEVLHYLDPQPHKVYLDVTFGSGGHTRAILEREPLCKVIAIDWDEVTLERFGTPLLEAFPDRLQLLWGNFSLLYKLLKKAGIQRVDGILADFGTSQVQIAERPGLSVYKDVPLDMRMSPPHQRYTAADICNNADERTLSDIFFTYGEERWSKPIARAIVQDRLKKPFKTTGDLVALIERVVPKDPKRKSKIHRATRVFQALRIYVNNELDNIKSFLPAALRVLSPAGRLVCISFHSLEDRMVKQFFKEQEQLGVVRLLTSKVVRPTEEEVALNPSSRSSRLRAAEKL